MGEEKGQLNLNAYFTRSDLKSISMSTCYALVAVKEALTQAKWTPDTEDERCRTGMRVGNSGCMHQNSIVMIFWFGVMFVFVQEWQLVWECLFQNSGYFCLFLYRSGCGYGNAYSRTRVISVCFCIGVAVGMGMPILELGLFLFVFVQEWQLVWECLFQNSGYFCLFLYRSGSWYGNAYSRTPVISVCFCIGVAVGMVMPILELGLFLFVFVQEWQWVWECLFQNLGYFCLFLYTVGMGMPILELGLGVAVGMEMPILELRLFLFVFVQEWLWVWECLFQNSGYFCLFGMGMPILYRSGSGYGDAYSRTRVISGVAVGMGMPILELGLFLFVFVQEWQLVWECLFQNS